MLERRLEIVMSSSKQMPTSPEQEKIAVIGLGYVGLPVALSFGRKLPTVGFDIRQRRIDELKKLREQLF